MAVSFAGILSSASLSAMFRGSLVAGSATLTAGHFGLRVALIARLFSNLNFHSEATVGTRRHLCFKGGAAKVFKELLRNSGGIQGTFGPLSQETASATTPYHSNTVPTASGTKGSQASASIPPARRLCRMAAGLLALTHLA